MQNSWFSSDWHLYSYTPSKTRNEMRQKFLSTEEMNSVIISNIMDRTKPGDNFYFLGDIGWKFPEKYLDELFTSFKKHKLNFHWINGNHDYKISSPSISSLVWRGDLKTIKIDGQKIILFHYPLHVWESSHYGAWSLHGHIHHGDHTWQCIERGDIKIEGKILNVNCELYNYTPLSFEEVKELMATKSENRDIISKPIGVN